MPHKPGGIRANCPRNVVAFPLVIQYNYGVIVYWEYRLLRIAILDFLEYCFFLSIIFSQQWFSRLNLTIWDRLALFWCAVFCACAESAERELLSAPEFLQSLRSGQPPVYRVSCHGDDSLVKQLLHGWSAIQAKTETSLTLPLCLPIQQYVSCKSLFYKEMWWRANPV